MKYISKDDDILVLDLSVRSRNCLNRAKIHTVGMLLDFPEEQFLTIRNLGQKTLDELLLIRKELASGQSEQFQLVERIEVPEHSNEPDEPDMKEAKTLLLADLPVSGLKLSVRANNCLASAGLTRISQLAGMSMEDLLSIKAMGRKTAREIYEAVHTWTLELSDAAAPTVETTFLEDLAGELNAVFNGDSSQWLKKLIALCHDDPVGSKGALLSRLHEEPAVRSAQKAAICDYLESHDDHGTLQEVMEAMEERMAPESVTAALLDELFAEGKLEWDGPLICHRYLSVIDFAETLTDERQRVLLLERLQGKTLQEIGEKHDLTRERVRQVLSKVLRNRPKLAEDKYTYLFENYYFSAEDFSFAFQEPEYVFNYLELSTGRKLTTTRPMEKALGDANISVKLRRQIEKAVYKQYVTVDGVRVLKKRPELVQYVVRRYCREDTDFDDFLQLYEMFLEDLGLSTDEDLRLEARTYENHLNGSREVLWKPGRKFRYYNIDEREYDDLLDTLKLEQYTDAALSTLLFFRQQPELMQAYDIRDEHELHNLLKKIWGDRTPEILFSRNPIMIFGKGTHEEQMLELLLQYAPIGLQELTEKYEEIYGMRAASVASNVLKNFNEYYHNGVFTIDAANLPPARFETMKRELTEDCYTIAAVQKLYQKLWPGATAADINPYTLKTLGFHVYSGYVISRRYANAREYSMHLMAGKDILDLNEFGQEQQFMFGRSGTLFQLKKERQLIEFEPRQFVHIRRLEAGGVDSAALEEYCQAVYNWIGPNAYFTVCSLHRSGFSHILDDLGFSDWFYSSVLCEDTEHFSYQRIGGTRLLYTGKCTVQLENLLVEILEREQHIELLDLIEHLRDEYGLQLDRYKLVALARSAGLYYDSIMETVYIDYDTYFEEI